MNCNSQKICIPPPLEDIHVQVIVLNLKVKQKSWKEAGYVLFLNSVT